MAFSSLTIRWNGPGKRGKFQERIAPQFSCKQNEVLRPLAAQLKAVIQKVLHMRRRLVIIVFLIVIALGRVMPMTLMPELGDPWYLSYTTTWFFVAGLLFFPSALVTQAVGLSFNGVTHLFVDAAWLIILCSLIYFYPFKSTVSVDENG